MRRIPDIALVGIPRPFLADDNLPLDQPRHGLLGGFPAGPFLAGGVGTGLVPFRRVDAGEPRLDAAPAPLLIVEPSPGRQRIPVDDTGLAGNAGIRMHLRNS